MEKIPLARILVRSQHLDVIGALLIFFVCYFKNFHGTIYFNGEIQFGIPFNDLWSFINQGAYPLGIFSTAGAVFSLLSTRLVGKQKNSGNVVSMVTTINSGANDFLFGNASSLITYPLTFVIHSFAFAKWRMGEKIRQIDSYYYLINIIGIGIGFGLVYLGAWLFGGRQDHTFLIVVAVTFGLSIGANFCNAFKYPETWLSWMVYNVVQLIKAVMQINIANVAKYIFYLLNSIVTLIDWKWNGDLNANSTVQTQL